MGGIYQSRFVIVLMSLVLMLFNLFSRFYLIYIFLVEKIDTYIMHYDVFGSILISKKIILI